MATAADLPGIHQYYIVPLRHCRYRIKDPKRSLDFYTRIIGMQLISKLDFPDMKFSLYFLGYHPESDIPDDPKDRVRRLDMFRVAVDRCERTSCARA